MSQHREPSCPHPHRAPLTRADKSPGHHLGPVDPHHHKLSSLWYFAVGTKIAQIHWAFHINRLMQYLIFYCSIHFICNIFKVPCKYSAERVLALICSSLIHFEVIFLCMLTGDTHLSNHDFKAIYSFTNLKDRIRGRRRNSSMN